MIDSVTIVGVGLIGASVGLALRERRLAKRVIGVGRSLATLEAAGKLRAIDDGTLDLEEGVRTANLVVIAAPPEQIVSLSRRVLAAVSADTLVTDCGSTKANIVRQLVNAKSTARFVGGHPLAGSEKTGPTAARADLFDGRTVVLTPGRGQQPDDPALQTVAEFWAALGASVCFCSPREHDRILARTSHLPHLAASALAAVTQPGDLNLTAGGWRDTTRIAAGDPELWTQILLDNSAAITTALDRYLANLQAFRNAVAQGRRTTLTRLLRTGKERRDALGS